MGWLIIFIIVAWFILRKLRTYHVPEQHVVMYSGTIGSGKTYIGVHEARAAYFRQAKRYKRYTKKYNFLYRFFVPSGKYEPHLFSTIPIKLGRKNGKPVFCEVLKKEHLLMEERLPEGAILFIDEIGAFASQWDFNNPQVQEKLQYFMRYFRHFLDGRMIVTDQSVGRVCKPIRELIGRVFWLHDFHRWLWILPFYDVAVIPMMMVEDSVTKEEDDKFSPTDVRHVRGLLPYKWLRMGVYDSRCYRILYDMPAKYKLELFTSLQCDYLIDLQVSAAVQKSYREHRDLYRQWIYQERPWNRLSVASEAAQDS